MVNSIPRTAGSYTTDQKSPTFIEHSGSFIMLTKTYVPQDYI